MMRVAYPMRVDALDKFGGDVEHIRTYIRHCEQLAQTRGFPFIGRILTDLNPNLSEFDVVHLTNLDRPVDLYSQFLAARRAKKPILLTPIHHSYREIERYERCGRGGLIGLISGLAGFYRLEAGRTLIKSRRYPQLRPSLWMALRKGLRNAQAEVLRGCDRVLPITCKEGTDIANEIAEVSSEKALILRNGYHPPPVGTVERDIDIAVIARIESRKNQIAILDAVQSLGLKATFVGSANPNHRRYCEAFRQKIAESSSNYIPGVSAQEVSAILARSRVHVSASWFEVASLVDIEAYTRGCRVVSSQCGGTHEVLGDDAYYVDPSSSADIAEKIAAAIESSRGGARNAIEAMHERAPRWEETCERLLDLYCSLRGFPAQSQEENGSDMNDDKSSLRYVSATTTIKPNLHKVTNTSLRSLPECVRDIYGAGGIA